MMNVCAEYDRFRVLKGIYFWLCGRMNLSLKVKVECANEGGGVYLVGGSPTSDISMSQGRGRMEP